MLKRKKLLIITVVVLVLMVAMATTALADAKAAYLSLSDIVAKNSGYLQSDESHAYGTVWDDSGNDMSMRLQKWNGSTYSTVQSINIYIVHSASIPKHYGTPTDRWRVQIYPNFGCCVHGQGTVYDY